MFLPKTLLDIHYEWLLLHMQCSSCFMFNIHIALRQKFIFLGELVKLCLRCQKKTLLHCNAYGFLDGILFIYMDGY